ISGAALIYVALHNQQVVVLFAFTVVFLSNTFLYGYFGQNLVNETSKTFRLAYSTPWYEWHKSNEKMLLLFLINSTSPMELHTGDIYVNYTVCAKCWKLCYTLLLTMRRLI
ncbi:unnamed protein product, partial [Callosobruchus maculatus]